MNTNKFKDYNLSKELIKAIEMLNYETPTKVQNSIIPLILNKKDVIVKSQTGSGKTAAFGIPMIELIDWDENKPQALVLTPTRELALQVKEDIFNIGRFKRIKVSAIYGKSPIRSQIKELKQKMHVVVGTPGRIIDHLVRGTLDISAVKHLVLDEADEMLNMGFVEQIEKVIKRLPKDRMNTLLSATMPSDIEKLCSNYLVNPVLIEIEDKILQSDKIIQERYLVNSFEKMEILEDLTIVENPDTCIIFCNTKIMVEEVQRKLQKIGYLVRKIHGGMEQDERINVMNNFRLGKYRYLVATDVAARGIDIDNISLIINYDIPQDSEYYVHRIGRTGRKDNSGKAITLYSKNEKKFLRDIHSTIAKEIPLLERPSTSLVEEKRIEFDLKKNTKPKAKEKKGAKLDKEILKLHINAGKKTKMRPTDIVGTLCNLEDMTSDDIGIIFITDVSTFVEILNNKGERVYKQLQVTPIKGRLRTVSRANS